MSYILSAKSNAYPGVSPVFLFVVPFARMFVPLGVGSRLSLMTLISGVTTKTVVVVQEGPTVSMTNHITAAKSYFPVIYKVNILEDVFGIAAFIWIVITVAFLIAFIVIYAQTISVLKGSSVLYGNVFVSDKITAPAVYGILRPKIILPQNYNESDLKYILAHERMHIKRSDNLKRILVLTLAGVHWFNPFTWLFVREYLSQTELACD